MAELASVRVDIEPVMVGLKRYQIFARQRINRYFGQQARALEAYMKREARWNNRTWQARNGLRADVVVDRFGNSNNQYYSISLYHTAPHGLYLELAMEKRFAILDPTARLKGPEVIRGMKGLFNE